MKIGMSFIGVGAAADPEAIVTIAQTSEACGFHSLWAPEHIVLLDRYSSKYPYTQNGVMPFPTLAIDLLDPFLALTYAAAVTRRIRLGTGICLLPERHPVIAAKEIASLDKLSGGRFDFGIGIGWLREEFEALQIPWERRAQRTRDYVAAMRVLWRDTEAEYQGEFVAFPPVRSFPKPVQQPHPPLIFGGESDAALKRVAEIGNGWWGVNLTVDAARESLRKIGEYARAAGRDPKTLSYAVSPGLGIPVALDDVKRYADLGVDQVIVGVFCANAEEFKRAIEQTAEALVVPFARG